MTSRPEIANDAVLVLGEDVALELANAELPGNGTGRRLIVAGQHDDVDARGAQALQGGWRSRLDWVRYGDNATGPAVYRKEKRRPSLAPELVRRGGQPAQVHAEILH